MNTLLNIDELAGTTIVPVWCGNERGTAFFISETQLLTAFHVVVENKVDGSAIYISMWMVLTWNVRMMMWLKIEI